MAEMSDNIVFVHVHSNDKGNIILFACVGSAAQSITAYVVHKAEFG